MKVSVNWVRQFLDFELPDTKELVARIGSQLGEVEGVVDLGKKYQGIIVAKVVECYKHEDSDHLNVCKIDDGGKAQNVERDKNGLVQVVCGAPNVRKDLLVAWLLPGSTVPSSYDKDPFVLGSRELRGKVSNGMLASAEELDISDDHEGILEIDKDASAGDDFASLYKLDDTIIDIENKMFTHRPDCFGALGVAREIAGILNKPFKSPDWYQLAPEFPAPEASLPLEIQNDLPELVPRFSAITMSNIQVEPSPLWLQIALSKVGQKSINNIVDLTNFHMLVTSQPLHAYDYDKVKSLSASGAKIVIRHPKSGEKVKLLNGKEIEPRSEAIMIATDQKLIGVGGVMGGSETEVDANTKTIILECANFDMYSIRRTSMAHGLFTDAVTRFNKGQSPLQTLSVLAKIVSDIQKLANGKVASDVIDKNIFVDRRKSIFLGARFIWDRLGVGLEAGKEIKTLLENVEFTVKERGEQKQEVVDSLDNIKFGKSQQIVDQLMEVSVPFWRTDIEIPEDIVEEVGRLYGYDKLPLELPERSIKPAKKDLSLELKAKIRGTLAKAGANEVLTYSFVHGNLLEKVGQDKNNAFQIANALSPDLQYYRLSLMPSLLDKVHTNIKAGHDEFALFEMGKAHIVGQNDNDGLPREDELLSLVVAASDKRKKTGAAYYQAQKYLANLLGDKLAFRPVPEAMRAFDLTKPYDMERTAFVYSGESFLGIIGEFRAEVRRNLKLPKYCAGFELDTLALAELVNDNFRYTELSKYPKVEQDICLKVASDISYQSLADLLEASLTDLKPSETLATLAPLDIYQKDTDASHKQITFRLSIASYEKTMLAGEVNQLLDELALAAKNKFKAERI